MHCSLGLFGGIRYPLGAYTLFFIIALFFCQKSTYIGDDYSISFLGSNIHAVTVRYLDCSVACQEFRNDRDTNKPMGLHLETRKVQETEKDKIF